MNSAIFSDINWLAVLVAAVAYFALGAIWYSFLFRKSWIRHTGVTMSNDPNAKKGIGGIMFTSFLTILVSSIGLALLLDRIGPSSWMSGAKIGLIAGICFCAMAISNSYLYEKRPMGLHFINGFYNIFGCVIAGIIIAVWPK
jgi:small-conductance mechanosensitive channel